MTRGLLGLLILSGLCLLAANWQENLRSQALKTRRLERGIPSHEEPQVNGEDGWSTLVLGTPSGATSIAPDKSAPKEVEPPATKVPASIPIQPPAPEFKVDRKLVIAPGDSLSRICEQHYGTSRLEVLEALARYNGLRSANQIRTGATLLLPDRDRLLIE
ncbi:MAG: hypothetical protein CMJ86_07140 [Planctomycetes bacterium]|nr:hypothetical protein [Planctomycetota bacterium]